MKSNREVIVAAVVEQRDSEKEYQEDGGAWQMRPLKKFWLQEVQTHSTVVFKEQGAMLWRGLGSEDSQ